MSKRRGMEPSREREEEEEKFLMSLQEELTTLRKRVNNLQSKVETKVEHEQKDSSRQGQVGDDLETLAKLMQEAKLAKLEAINYARTDKAQLFEQVKHFYELLQEAKREKLSREQYIKSLERKLEETEREKLDVTRQLEVDRESFDRTIREEREKYSTRLHDLLTSCDCGKRK